MIGDMICQETTPASNTDILESITGVTSYQPDMDQKIELKCGQQSDGHLRNSILLSSACTVAMQYLPIFLSIADLYVL